MRASDIISGWNIVRENDHGHAMIEIDRRYYIAYISRSYEFVSALPGDMEDGNRLRATLTTDGLRAVTKGRSRAAANTQWRKYVERH